MTDEQPHQPRLSHRRVAQLVNRYGLQRAGQRPDLARYTRELWQRREFVVGFATARNEVGYSGSFLGQAWQVLTPLLNVAVYYFIFGLVLHTNRGVSNFIAFLVIGVFTFNFTQTSVLHGARSISSNDGLTRALHFPRAVLPIAATLSALQRFGYSAVIMVLVVLATGAPLRVQWVLAVPAIALLTMFNLGLSLVMARVGAKIPDLSQALPFVLRTWLYFSGVFYSTSKFTENLGAWVRVPLNLNPGAVYLNLVRDAMLPGISVPGYEWPLALAWALVVLGLGYVFFWKEEESYGSV